MCPGGTDHPRDVTVERAVAFVYTKRGVIMPMRSYIARLFVTPVFLFVPAVGINTSCDARLAPAPDSVNLDLMTSLRHESVPS